MDLNRLQQIQTNVEELLQQIGVDFVSPEVEIEEAGSVKIDLQIGDQLQADSGLGLLIGPHGETLLALQYVLALMINRGSEEWLRVQVDVDGYREKRRLELEELAQRMIERVLESGEEVALRPMSSADRRLVHMYLSTKAGVVTESTGEGRDRRIVIRPA